MKRTQRTFPQQTSHTGILAQLWRVAEAFGKTDQLSASLIVSFDVLCPSLLFSRHCKQKGAPLFREHLPSFLAALPQLRWSPLAGGTVVSCLGVDCDATLGRLGP